jgi:hypothetical protein
MYLQNLIEESIKQYKEPAMLLLIPPKIFKTDIHLPRIGFDIVNFPEEEIFKTFSKNPKTNAIVISGYEPMQDMGELRSFIFSARKFFSPNNRPRIIIYTKFFFDELQDLPGWNGLYCEILQYGNIFLKHGRRVGRKERPYFNKDLGCQLMGKSEDVIRFIGHQYI